MDVCGNSIANHSGVTMFNDPTRDFVFNFSGTSYLANTPASGTPPNSTNLSRDA
jgi:hypothetical protein